VLAGTLQGLVGNAEMRSGSTNPGEGGEGIPERCEVSWFERRLRMMSKRFQNNYPITITNER